MSMGHTYKFFSFSISYTILNLPLSILYLPFMLLIPCTDSPIHTPPPHPLSSCPWVMDISSLASPFPILFLTSPCLFCTYQLCFLISVSFPQFSPFRLPAGNPTNDLYNYDSVLVLLICLVCFLRFSC